MSDDLTMAQTCSEQMHSNDHCAHALGIQICESTPGFARLAMQVRQDMLNGHNICHGGMIFTLADTAFAHACNNTNRSTVANGCNIEFLSPASLNDTLIATATERQRGGRNGVYDVEVTRESDEKLIALFRGKSTQIRGSVVGGLDD